MEPLTPVIRGRIDEWLYENLSEEMLGGTPTLKTSQVLRAVHSQDDAIRILAHAVIRLRAIQVVEVD